jgi:hypothetical protein
MPSAGSTIIITLLEPRSARELLRLDARGIGTFNAVLPSTLALARCAPHAAGDHPQRTDQIPTRARRGGSVLCWFLKGYPGSSDAIELA